MSFNKEQFETEYAIRKETVPKVDDKASEVKMRIQRLDPDAPYYLYYTVTLKTSPGYAKYDVDEFLFQFRRIDGVELL